MSEGHSNCPRSSPAKRTRSRWSTFRVRQPYFARSIFSRMKRMPSFSSNFFCRRYRACCRGKDIVPCELMTRCHGTFELGGRLRSACPTIAPAASGRTDARSHRRLIPCLWVSGERHPRLSNTSQRRSRGDELHSCIGPRVSSSVP